MTSPQADILRLYACSCVLYPQLQLALDDSQSVCSSTTTHTTGRLENEHRRGCADVAKHCFSCGHANGFTQHWCDECGCSLLPASQDAVNFRDMDRNHGSFTKITVTTSKSSLTTEKLCSVNSPIHSVMPLRAARRPLYCSVKRRWPKASFYSWRKPSSLNTATRHCSIPQPHPNTESICDLSSSYSIHSLPAQIEGNVSQLVA